MDRLCSEPKSLSSGMYGPTRSPTEAISPLS